MAGNIARHLDFSLPGALTVQDGTIRSYFGEAWSIIAVRASVGTAPVGASIILDVWKNGATIYTTAANKPTIAAGANTVDAALPDVTSIAAGDYLTVNIDQVGSTTAGSDLVVEIVLAPAV